MSLNTPQEEQAGLKPGFQIWQCFSFCSPTPQTIISERSQSKDCPAVHRERGENSHVTDWKVSPPSCLTMWYPQINLLSWTTSEDKTDKISRSLSLFYIQLLGMQISETQSSAGVKSWRQGCKCWQVRVFLQQGGMGVREGRAISFSCWGTGTFSTWLHLCTFLWLTAGIAGSFPMCHPCACPGTGLHETWYKPSLNYHPVALPI